MGQNRVWFSFKLKSTFTLAGHKMKAVGISLFSPEKFYRVDLLSNLICVKFSETSETNQVEQVNCICIAGKQRHRCGWLLLCVCVVL